MEEERQGLEAQDAAGTRHQHKWIAYAYEYRRRANHFLDVRNLWPSALLSVGRNRFEAQLLYFFVLPALCFRFFPFIMTHNSTPLSAYLAVVLVCIPAKVALTLWELSSSSSARPGAWLEKGDGPLLPPWWREPSRPSYAPSRWSRFGPKKGQGTTGLALLLCGAACSLWAYTAGMASPFPTAASLVASSPTLKAQQARNATYYIAATFWNNEDILNAWAAETLQLINVLGYRNVYVSMTENDSTDDTVSKLLRFSDQLTEHNVMHNVNITSGLREEPLEDPWRSVRHRMGYMTNLRNGALESLGKVQRRFDVVVLLNDIVYHHTDVLKLTAALGGDDLTGKRDDHLHQPKRRRMACGLDMDGATLYDTWVLQDRCGQPVSGLWPFFTAERDKKLVRQGQVVEVGTCWNGIAVLDGDMFLEPSLRSKTAEWDAETLRFREPPQCAISECSLLPVVITNVTGGSPIVVDPTVVVAYSLRWWRYYAVWLRLPVVRIWMRLFEEKYWALWWNMGMGEGLRWTHLDAGDEKECMIEGWPSCDSASGVEKGSITLREKPDPL